MNKQSPQRRTAASMRARLSESQDAISSGAWAVLKGLQDGGFEAWLAGGCVRDLLLGLRPTDFDVATNARPEEVMETFPRTVPTGISHGTVTVLWSASQEKGSSGGADRSAEQAETREKASDRPGTLTDLPQGGASNSTEKPKKSITGEEIPHHPLREMGRKDGGASPSTEAIEVTTYRGEGEYRDGRRPETVRFLDSITEDLSRRDFTINALAYNPLNDELRDPFGGVADLARRRLRAVGSPEKRFTEDGLRPLRAVRFASVLRLGFERDTQNAIGATLTTFQLVASERVRDELDKILLHSPFPSRGMSLLASTGLLEHILPELNDLATQQRDTEETSAEVALAHVVAKNKEAGSAQLRSRSVSWKCLLNALDHSRPTLSSRMAILMLFVPLQPSPGHETHPGDEAGSEAEPEKAHGLQTTLQAPNTSSQAEHQITQRIRHILERLRYPRALIRQVCHLVLSQREALDSQNSPEELRREMARIGAENLSDTLNLREALIKGCLPRPNKALDDLSRLRTRMHVQLMQKIPLQLKDLAIDGKTLQQALELPPGPFLGRLLHQLLEHVLDHPEDNRQTRLIEVAQQIIQQSFDDHPQF